LFRRLMSLIRSKKSFTLFEVVVATLIFSLAIGGLIGVFIAGKRNVLHSRERMSSTEIGKVFIEPLQLYVRQSDWNASSNALTLGTTYCDSSGSSQNPACPSSGGQRVVNGVDYTAQYEVTGVSGTSVRKAKTKISWSEFSP